MDALDRLRPPVDAPEAFAASARDERDALRARRRRRLRHRRFAVVDSVNAYLRTLVSQGAILGGECFVDEDMNPASELAQGKVRFSYKFTPPAPMEDMQFDSATVTDYYDAVFSA